MAKQALQPIYRQVEACALEPCVSIVRDDFEFEALREEWSELLAHSGNHSMFLTWRWLHTWWTHHRGDRQLHIILVRRGGLLIGVAPLAQRPPRRLRLVPFRVLEFLGAGNVGSDYLDVIVRSGYEPDVLPVLADALSGLGIALEAAQVDAERSHLPELATLLVERGWWSNCKTTLMCPYVRLPGTFDEYLQSLGASHRYNFRRRLRQLKKRFSVRFEAPRDASEARKFLEILMWLHVKRWRDRGGSNALNTEQLKNFHRELLYGLWQSRQIRLYVLMLDSRPAAAIYGFVYNKCFYFYQSGFDDVYARFSVGLVALGLAIEKAIDEGATHFDMLRGDESYKFLWTSSTRELVRFDLFPSRLGATTFFLSSAVKSLVNRLRMRRSRHGAAR